MGWLVGWVCLWEGGGVRFSFVGRGCLGVVAALMLGSSWLLVRRVGQLVRNWR